MMNSVALLLLVAAGLSAANGLAVRGIEDIIDVHGGNANDYADQVS